MLALGIFVPEFLSFSPVKALNPSGSLLTHSDHSHVVCFLIGNMPQFFSPKKAPVRTQVGLLFCVVLSFQQSKRFVHNKQYRTTILLRIYK